MSDVKKSTTLELTINPAYVRNWGVWEAIRELVQNGLDSHDQGNDLTIERGGGASKTIYIRNAGTTLARSTLLLGSTSKDDGASRGKFGEGYKLAFLVLARNGIEVQLRTGSEMWTPFVEKSETFGSDLLKVKIRPQPKFENKVEVQIHGVSDEDWKTIQERLINVPGLPDTQVTASKMIEVGRDRILLDERFRSKLFCRGIFVSRLPDEYVYGYDLADVSLDRDRKAPEVWSLRSEISSAIRGAVERSLLNAGDLYTLLSSECGESKIIAEYYAYGYSDALSKAISEEFERLFGADALPVTSMAESLEMEHYGYNGRVTTKALRTLIEKEKGTLESRKSKKAFDPSRLYSVSDLSSEEKSNLIWAAGLVHKVKPQFSLDMLQVVNFFGNFVDGTYGERSGVRVAKKILVDKKNLLATIVHEAAHMDGAEDGSVEHRNNIERIFAEIVVSISG